MVSACALWSCIVAQTDAPLFLFRNKSSMSVMNPDLLGNGRVIFQWSPKGNYLAAAGPKVSLTLHAADSSVKYHAWSSNQTISLVLQRKVNILDRNGRLYDEVALPQPEIQLSDSSSPSCAELQVCNQDECGALLHQPDKFIPVHTVGSCHRAAGHPACWEHHRIPVVGRKQGGAKDWNRVQGDAYLMFLILPHNAPARSSIS